MTSRIAIGALCVLLSGVASSKIPVYITAAVADPKRPETDTQRDADRKPAEFITFAGIRPGDKVIELDPGKGYFTRILSRTVGPQGRVYAYVPSDLDALYKKANIPVPPPPEPDYPNVTFVYEPIAKVHVPEAADLVWTTDNIHDFHNKLFGPTDMQAMTAAVYRALKPGGVYIVADHVAEAGSGLRDTETLHRIDPSQVKAEALAAGFVLEGESHLLRNPADNHTKTVFDGSIRWKTDQFIFKFRKPGGRTAQIHMGIDASEFRARRQAVMAAASDGIVLLHSASAPKNWNDSGFQQDSFFYYFTGLENLHDAILGIDGISKQTWLFVLPPTNRRQQRISADLIGWDAAYLQVGVETEQLLGIDHVVPWERFADFIEARRKANPVLALYLDQGGEGKMVADVSNPPGLAPIENPFVLWTAAIKAKWPDANVVDAAPIIKPIRAVKSHAEVALLRLAARFTDAGFRAAILALAPGRTNHWIEGAAVEAAMRAGADGPGMWPEVKSGAVSGATVFQKFYDYHLQNRTLHAGETVLIDLGFNYELYKGDVGRTMPVTGHFTPEQAEVIDFMDEAYQAGLRAMRDGVSGDEVIQTSIRYVADHRLALRSELARRAVAELLKPGVWVMYSHGIDAVEIFPVTQMHSGNTIAYGPDFNVDGVGFYEEDLSLITPSGHELINPALPYKAADIEKMMARPKHSRAMASNRPFH